MLEALLISNAMLWVAVVLLAAVVLALVRQVGVLHERIAPAGALLGDHGPRIGERVGRFELPDWAGRAVAIGGETGEQPTLVLFVSPTCPVCATVLPIAESLARSQRARLVVASDGPRGEHETFVRAHGLDEQPYVLSAELGIAFRVGKLPYAVLIDAQGILRAKGLVNTREHLESLFEAQARGVASVQEFLQRDGGTRRVA